MEAFTSVAAGCSGPEDPALDIWKLSWNTGELSVANQVQIAPHSDLREVWRQGAQFVATQVQTASHSDLPKVWRQGAECVVTQVQISSAQDVSKGLWEFSNLAGAQVPVHQQSIGIKTAAPEDLLAICSRADELDFPGHDLSRGAVLATTE